MSRRIYQNKTYLLPNLLDMIVTGRMKMWHYDNVDMVFDPEGYEPGDFDTWIHGVLQGMPPGEIVVCRHYIEGRIEEWMVSGQDRYAPLAAAYSGAWEHSVSIDGLEFPMRALGDSQTMFDFARSIVKGDDKSEANRAEFYLSVFRASALNCTEVINVPPQHFQNWLIINDQLEDNFVHDLSTARKERTS